MKDNQKFLSVMHEKSKSPSSQVQYSPAGGRSLSSLLAETRERIEVDCFDRADTEQAEELALIIAEVMRLPNTVTVRIAGNDLPADMVAEIYGRIDHDHVLHVIENYNKATYEIKHTKTYLRTALYNAVFETRSRAENQVNTDMPWLARG